MKRRIFLAAASTVGIAGVVSSSSLVSSTYSSISTSVLLEEFSQGTRTALDKFISDVSQNVQAHGLDRSLTTNIAMPVQIISKNNKGGNQSIVYKNKSGNYISLTVTDGVEQIAISHSL